jgi:hypothetical protein
MRGMESFKKSFSVHPINRYAIRKNKRTLSRKEFTKIDISTLKHSRNDAIAPQFRSDKVLLE